MAKQFQTVISQGKDDLSRAEELQSILLIKISSEYDTLHLKKFTTFKMLFNRDFPHNSRILLFNILADSKPVQEFLAVNNMQVEDLILDLGFLKCLETQRSYQVYAFQSSYFSSPGEALKFAAFLESETGYVLDTRHLQNKITYKYSAIVLNGVLIILFLVSLGWYLCIRKREVNNQFFADLNPSPEKWKRNEYVFKSVISSVIHVIIALLLTLIFGYFLLDYFSLVHFELFENHWWMIILVLFPVSDLVQNFTILYWKKVHL